LIVLAIAAVAVVYHYAVTRDIRQKLHRIANALENLEDYLASCRPGADEGGEE